ncbi:MAG: hypothetical protein ACTSRG_02035 [Candidatus Helarchaeota archaeon]
MSIEWAKIEQNPEKNFKIQGVNLLNLKLKIELLNKNIEELTISRDKLKSLKNSLEEQNEKLNSDIKNKEDKIADLEKKIKEINENLDKTKRNNENIINELNQKISDLKNSLSKKNDEIDNLNHEISEKNLKLSELEKTTDEKTKEISGLQERKSKLENEKSNLNNEVSDLKNKISELETKNSEIAREIENLRSEISTKSSEIENLQKKIAEKEEDMVKKDSEIEGLHSKNEELNKHIEELTEQLEESNTKTKEASVKIEELNTKIEELNAQLPKKVVYETPEQVVKAGPCPKCGQTTFEEFKIVNGKKQILRKYCPNTSCGWRSAHVPETVIHMSDKAPEELKQELKIFWIKREGIETVNSLDSSMVAIITDPDQNLIWIWKGKNSSRFDYAEATQRATEIKEKQKLFHAHIERVEDGEEPVNFPKI